MGVQFQEYNFEIYRGQDTSYPMGLYLKNS